MSYTFIHLDTRLYGRHQAPPWESWEMTPKWRLACLVRALASSPVGDLHAQQCTRMGVATDPGHTPRGRRAHQAGAAHGHSDRAVSHTPSFWTGRGVSSVQLLTVRLSGDWGVGASRVVARQTQTRRRAHCPRARAPFGHRATWPAKWGALHCRLHPVGCAMGLPFRNTRPKGAALPSSEAARVAPGACGKSAARRRRQGRLFHAHPPLS